MFKTALSAAAVFAVLSIAAADHVQAQSPFAVPGCGYGYAGFGLLGSPYALGRVPEPPYFAIHPPVYYSHPVPRTYGYSPFAYPGSVRTPEIQVEATTAKAIRNPYAAPVRSEQPPQVDINITKSLPAPLEVINPFVDRAETKMVAVEDES